MSNLFDKLFKNKNSNQNKKGVSKNYENGIESYRKGCLLFDKRRDEGALKYFDIALECGITEAYQERALCLSSLKYYLDAIDDYNKAIALMPEDCNLYYGRGVAKNATGDYAGAILDGELALTYSKFETEMNRNREEKYKNKGFENFRVVYEMDLMRWKMDLERQKDELDFVNKLKESGKPEDIEFAEDQLKRSQRLINENSKRREK